MVSKATDISRIHKHIVFASFYSTNEMQVINIKTRAVSVMYLLVTNKNLCVIIFSKKVMYNHLSSVCLFVCLSVNRIMRNVSKRFVRLENPLTLKVDSIQYG